MFVWSLQNATLFCTVPQTFSSLLDRILLTRATEMHLAVGDLARTLTALDKLDNLSLIWRQLHDWTWDLLLIECKTFCLCLYEKDNGDPVVTGYANKQQLPAVVQVRDDAVCVRETNFNLVTQSAKAFGSLCVLWSEEISSNEVGKIKASGLCGVKHLARLSLIFKESEQANSSQVKDCWLDSKHLPILLPQSIKVFLEQTVEW